MQKVIIRNSDLFKCFQIDLGNYFNTRTRLIYHLHLQPSEWENAPFYEFQYYIKELIKIVEEKNGANNNQDYSEQYNDIKNQSKSYMNKYSPRSMNANFKKPKF